MPLTLLHLAALAALAGFTAAVHAPVPAGEGPVHGTRFWLPAMAALAGSAAAVWVDFSTGWRSGLAPALWLTIAATLALFAIGAWRGRVLTRLAVLLAPYLFILAVLATVWARARGGGLAANAPGAWIDLHILVSVGTYALITLAAMAALAVALQERALKRRRPSRLTALLPSVRDAERLQVRLLGAGAVVLGLGLATGMVTAVLEGQPALPFTHKTLLSGLAFVVIVALIVIQRRSGLAGRRAARWLLVAYLLLSLAYPGVKFVTEVILA